MPGDVVEEWLDPDELRALAEGLMTPQKDLRLEMGEPVYGDEFEGFLGDPGEELVQEEIEIDHSESSSLVGDQLEKPETPSLPMEARLQAFGIWLREHVPNEGYFLCNAEGEIVVDEYGGENLAGVAGSLANAYQGLQADGQGNRALRVKIGENQLMEVLPCEWGGGRLVLSLIVGGPVSQETSASVVYALKTVLEG